MFKSIFGKQDSEETMKIFSGNMVNHRYALSQQTIDKLVSIMKYHLDKTKVFYQNIPEKKLANVTGIYQVPKESIIAIYDTTVFGSGKDGVVLCDDLLGLKKAFEAPLFIEYDKLVISEFEEGQLKFRIDETLHTPESKAVYNFCKEVRTVLIHGEESLKEIHEMYVRNKLDQLKIRIDRNEYNEADTELTSLKKVVIYHNNQQKTEIYYYAALIKAALHDFLSAYNYHETLSKNNLLSKEECIKLKQTLDQMRDHNLFSELSEEKNRRIKNFEFDQAIKAVEKQKELGLESVESLDLEIDRIKTLEKDYIDNQEKRLLLQFKEEKFQDAEATLRFIKKLNPLGDYEEYDIRLMIGQNRFVEAMEVVSSLKEKNPELHETLWSQLMITMDKTTSLIIEAVKNKNYDLFNENKDMALVNDKWGMTPLMHFILHKDYEGTKMLAYTYDDLIMNVLGHDALNLAVLNYEDTFFNSVLQLLDEDLSKMYKKFSRKEALDDLASIAVGAVDLFQKEIYAPGLDLTKVGEVKSMVEKDKYKFETELEKYIADKIMKNYWGFVESLVDPYDIKKEHEDLLEEKRTLLKKKVRLEEKKDYHIHSVDQLYNKALEKELESYLISAAQMELGPKNEFETTKTYQDRISKFADEIRPYPGRNGYVMVKLQNLKKKIRESINKEVQKANDELTELEDELKYTEEDIRYIKYLVFCAENSNPSEVIDYYYSSYPVDIEIGSYNADAEKFAIMLNGENVATDVPISIAKDFKDDFGQLKPTVETSIEAKGKTSEITQNLIYHYKDHSIRVPFKQVVL